MIFLVLITLPFEITTAGSLPLITSITGVFSKTSTFSGKAKARPLIASDGLFRIPFSTYTDFS